MYQFCEKSLHPGIHQARISKSLFPVQRFVRCIADFAMIPDAVTEVYADIRIYPVHTGIVKKIRKSII